MLSKNLAFLESATDETPIIGAFTMSTDANTFDRYFEEAVEKLKGKEIDYFLDAQSIVKTPAIMQVFKEATLAGLHDEAAQRSDSETWGTYSNITNQVDQLWENCTDNLYKEMANMGSLKPISMIDYPILVKQHLRLTTKDIVQTSVVNSPVVKKQIERRWIVDPANPTERRWEYPQCFFRDDWKEIYKAGNGLEIKSTPVALPLFNYDLIGELTDAAVPAREKLSYNTHIVAGYLDDDTKIPLDMSVSLHLGNWTGGMINRKVKKADGTEVDVSDVLSGQVDFTTGRISLSSASGQIKKVSFGGNISNEKNERAVTFDYTREEKEWKISDNHRVNIPYSVEELDDAKALLTMNLYQKSYTNIADYLTQMEDSKVLGFLDEMFVKYSGVDLDPLGFNAFVRTMNFDCDSTTTTTALPHEYVEKQLKFYIERFIIDLTETAKMQDMTFVIYGNPKYISLLGDCVKWVIKPGNTTGGVKHDYSYGVMTTTGVTVQVVSAQKFSATDDNHKGLRLVPFPLSKEQMTFAHWKYTTHVMTATDSAYRDANLPGGSKTMLVGVSRYEDGCLQGIQGYMTFSNADFLHSKTLTVSP